PAPPGEGGEGRAAPAPTDHVPAGRRYARAAEAGEQRAGHEEGRADPAAQLGVELYFARSPGTDSDIVPSEPVHVGADIREQRQHRLALPAPRGGAGHDPAAG